MRVIWSDAARNDLDRLYDFLAPKSLRAAETAVRSLLDAPSALLDMPRMGMRLEGIEKPEVRRIIIRQYELRYQVEGDVIRILRVLHTRENR